MSSSAWYSLAVPRLRSLCSIFIVFVLLFFFAKPVHAQTFSAAPATPNTYDMPNTNPDVPLNQHTFAQSAMIEVLSAIMCQLVGVDPVNTNKSCLTIDPQTHKLGYAPSNNSDHLRAGGLLGTASQMIAVLYTPTTSSVDYFGYLASNFGIVDRAYAASTPASCTAQQASGLGYGFCGLEGILKLWTAFRNFAYALLTLAFIFIGVGIMLRVKIDPRTVMTIQNQIPRIVICLLLITTSYAISAIMIDFMWLSTYVSINMITSIPGENPTIPTCVGNNGNTGPTLAGKAETSLLDTPITYANRIYLGDCNPDIGLFGAHTGNTFRSGLVTLTNKISDAIGQLMNEIVDDFLGGSGCSINPFNFHIEGCIASIIGFLAHIFVYIIIFVVILVILFQIWFQLLKAYVYVLLYVITAPIWMVFGLLPGRPLGFEKWMRTMFANLAVFPLTASLLVGARLFMDLFSKNPTDKFIPPLIGNPNMPAFGVLIAFGVLLMTPSILNMLRDAMKVPGSKHGANIRNNLVAGAAIATAPFVAAQRGLYRRDQYGRPEGIMAQRRNKRLTTIGNWLMDTEGRRQYVPKPLKNLGGRIVQQRESLAGGRGKTTDMSGKQYREEAIQRQKQQEKQQQPPSSGGTARAANTGQQPTQPGRPGQTGNTGTQRPQQPGGGTARVANAGAQPTQPGRAGQTENAGRHPTQPGGMQPVNTGTLTVHANHVSFTGDNGQASNIALPPQRLNTFQSFGESGKALMQEFTKRAPQLAGPSLDEINQRGQMQELLNRWDDVFKWGEEQNLKPKHE